jgi:hypothetical protein
VRRAVLALQAVVIGLAAASLWLPLPADVVERYYADWIYPSLQGALTSWSNTSRISLFDPLVILLGLAVVIGWVRTLRVVVRRRTLRPLGRAALSTLVFGSVVYLWFSGVWGLNYARTRLEDAIGYQTARVTPSALRELADRAVQEVNRTYSAAHAAGFPEIGDVPAPLVNALHAVEHRLGRAVPTIPGRPKRTLLAWFFRASGVDGMHAPFLLETLLNPDLTPPERPVVLAHEWAHLSGYAPESDASFVGLLASLRADPPAQYSAWLALFDDALGQLPAAERPALVARLGPGPQADRRAIRERLTARVELIARASWQTYDQYLKAQGVSEGVQSYSRVVQLLLGSGALDWK